MLDLDGVGIGGRLGGAKDDSDRTAPLLTLADKGSLLTPVEDLVIPLGDPGLVPVLIRLARIPSLALALGTANLGDLSAAFSALMTRENVTSYCQVVHANFVSGINLRLVERNARKSWAL
jgi:hypothetical protein